EPKDRLRVEYGDLFISTYLNDIPCYNLAPEISDIQISLNAKKSDIEYYAKLDAVDSIYEVLEAKVDD
ncbi:MAG: hypothetical protein IJN86_03350, partial [Clostridia bacterium]|nr:hypothetical protein [Clostridia bacterium]